MDEIWLLRSALMLCKIDFPWNVNRFRIQSSFLSFSEIPLFFFFFPAIYSTIKKNAIFSLSLLAKGRNEKKKRKKRQQHPTKICGVYTMIVFNLINWFIAARLLWLCAFFFVWMYVCVCNKNAAMLLSVVVNGWR